jgi:transcriptional regulator with GAF, ATPase, and Fis domain
LQELGIFIHSATMREAAERAAIMAQSDLARVVLLQGETGTGKELFAKLIHRMSDRHGHGLVTVNCAVVQKDLAESLLFGHVRGAFTGATTNRKGKFDVAHGSTLFLDELAELPPEVQAKLLRVVEDFKVEPLGSNDSHEVDVRVIVATNRNLESAVADGQFREDLYFRLKGRRITLPPLRARQGEIPHLAVSLLQRINQRCKRPRKLSKEALRRLEQYPWPGNVREMASVLETAVLWSRADVIEPEDLTLERKVRADGSVAGLPEPHAGFVLDNFLQQVKKQLIERALEKSSGNQKAAGDLLGWSKQRISAYVLGQADKTD